MCMYNYCSLHSISYYTVVEIGFNMVMSNFTEDNEVVDVEIYKQGLTTLTTVVNVTSVCNASGMQLLVLVLAYMFMYFIFLCYFGLMQKGLTLTAPWLNRIAL